jgi:hypothetical protein
MLGLDVKATYGDKQMAPPAVGPGHDNYAYQCSKPSSGTRYGMPVLPTEVL